MLTKISVAISFPRYPYSISDQSYTAHPNQDCNFWLGDLQTFPICCRLWVCTLHSRSSEGQSYPGWTGWLGWDGGWSQSQARTPHIPTVFTCIPTVFHDYMFLNLLFACGQFPEPWNDFFLQLCPVLWLILVGRICWSLLLYSCKSSHIQCIFTEMHFIIFKHVILSF